MMWWCGQVLDWDNAAYLQLSPSYKLLNMYFQVLLLLLHKMRSITCVRQD
jgi:hypothetical protein